ncbi:MAG: TAXI family TRAP transporter solute-binding subunit [Methylovirgula sp.]
MRHMIYIWLAAGLGLLALFGLAIYLYERPVVLRVAFARGGDDQAILAAAAQKFAHDRDSIRLKLVPVGDVAEAAQLFAQDRADLAVVRTDIAMPTNGQSVLIMRKNLVILIAPGDSKLKNVADLKGHKVGVLHNTPPTGTHREPKVLETILAQYDVPLQSVTAVPLALDDVRQAVDEKKVDAVLAVGVPDTGTLAKTVRAVTAASQKPPVFIPISEAKAIADRSPYYESADVVRGLFGGLPPRPLETFQTLSVETRLVARSRLKDETVAALTKLLLTVRPILALRIPVANRIEAPSTTRGAALPVHPGAAAYLDDEEESFFDKYSDAIYIGALCLSVLGSAAAALASRMNGRTNESDDVLLVRLLAIIKAAREADPEALDALEAEVDNLLAVALMPEVQRLKSEVPRINTLSIAFEHVRHALKQRRQTLAGAGREASPNVLSAQDAEAGTIKKASFRS